MYKKRLPTTDLRFLLLLTALNLVIFTLALLWGVGSTEGMPGADIVLALRLPRALLACCIGALLALAGVQMQAVLRNPLADPYILGTASGAGVAALSALLLGAAGWVLNASAMAGALLATTLVLAASLKRPDPLRTLLTGVGLGAACSAIITLLLSLSPQARLTSLLFWLMGDLSSSPTPFWLPVATLMALTLAWSGATRLDLLALGSTKANTLGLNAERALWITLVQAALFTGIAVSLAGPIGFVGLLVPHLIRLWHGSLHQMLVPASALLGSAFLLLADTLAQHLFRPYQLPVGVLTALCGAPWLIWLLWQRQEARP